MLRLLIGLCFWFACIASASAAAVWEVSKGDNKLHIGGTFHLLSKNDYPLPKEYELAYSQSQKLIFETDFDAFRSPEFAQQMMSTFLYANGNTVESALKPATVKRLKSHLTSRNQVWEEMKYFKPALLMTVITVSELQAIGFNKAGVDEFYFERAGKDTKPRGWLESVEQQMLFLKEMGAGNPDDLINYTLEDLQDLSQSMDKLRASWRSGDMNEMAALAIDEMQSGYPDIYQTLLVSRNKNWVPQIETMLTTPETELVLVGALHLAGKDSVLTMLKAKGYTVKKL